MLFGADIGPRPVLHRICDGDDSAWEHMTDGDCWNTTHPINGTCKRKCELGYALGGIRSLHDAWVRFHLLKGPDPAVEPNFCRWNN